MFVLRIQLILSVEAQCYVFSRGEKYMGMWEADSRHGPGLLVTLDGIYNQGTFLQNKLVVCANFWYIELLLN